MTGTPRASGSTHGAVAPVDGSAVRGWGGNGDGWGSQPTVVARFASIARHTAYAVPARTPRPNARHTVLRRTPLIVARRA